MGLELTCANSQKPSVCITSKLCIQQYQVDSLKLTRGVGIIHTTEISKHHKLGLFSFSFFL